MKIKKETILIGTVLLTVGLIGLGFGWYSSITKLQWIVLFLFGLSWYLFNVFRAGKSRFWKLVGHYPEKAYKYFKDHPETWIVLDSNQIKNVYQYLRDKHIEHRDKYIGPYRLYVPSIGNIVYIYGKKDSYEQEQDQLISLLEN